MRKGEIMTQADEQEFQRELELLRENCLKDNPLRRECGWPGGAGKGAAGVGR